jgi:putative DNA primase/helicase
MFTGGGVSQVNKLNIPDGAKYFFDAGVPVVPFRFVAESGKKASKKPLVPWAQWQTRSQTLQEFESQPWSQANGFLVVCGTLAKNNYYFCAIDRDSNDFNFDEIPETIIEQTPNRGYHAYYWSKVNHRGRKFHECQLEFLGEGNLCGIYPTPFTGYNEYHHIACVPDAWSIFTDLIERAGCFQDAGAEISVPNLLEGSPEHGDGVHMPRDQAAIRLATFYRTKGHSQEETLRLLKEWDVKNRPPLGEAVLRAKVQQAFKNPNPYSWRFIEDHNSIAIEKKEEFFSYVNGYPHFEPVIFARSLMQKHTFKVMRDNYDIFVYYPEIGIWKREGEQIIKAEMGELLGEDNRKRFIEDVKHAIICEPNMMVPRPTPPIDKIGVENGILNLQTGKIEEPNPDNFVVTRIPVKFDPEAKCPEIDKFMLGVLPQDTVRQMVHESIAYTLHQARPIHKAMLAVGPPETGKSTFLKMVRKFLGKENVSDVALQVLCEQRFASAELYLKLANMSADLPQRALKSIGTFNMAIGDDPITGEHKHAEFFSFEPYAKHFYSCNNIPEASDDSGAYFRRWNIFEFTISFTGEKRDTNILNKITTPTELSGLLNRCLKDLPELLKRGHFLVDTETSKIREKYILKSNSTHAFIEKKLQQSLSYDDYIDKATLYRTYVQFCTDLDERPLGMGDLTKGMKLKLAGAELKQTGEEKTRVWRYVKWKAT